MRKGLPGALVVVALAAFAGTAAAQDTGGALISDPTVIRSCMCEQEAVTALLDTLHARQQTYDQSQKALQSLNNQVATRRTAINVYDDSEIEGYKQLLQQRDAAQASFSGPVTDSYNAAVNTYNQAVAGYNGSCAGRSYDESVVNQVRLTQSCPRP
jgi:hypothetical protein